MSTNKHLIVTDMAAKCKSGGGVIPCQLNIFCFVFLKEKKVQNVLKRKNMYRDLGSISCYFFSLSKTPVFCCTGGWVRTVLLIDAFPYSWCSFSMMVK